jgi:8-oxo-dGTP diphosphatase
MIDPGETPRQAAVRELREETGIHVDDMVFLGYARFVLGTDLKAHLTEYGVLSCEDSGGARPLWK